MTKQIELICARRGYRNSTSDRERVAYLAERVDNEFAAIAHEVGRSETTVRRWIQHPETGLRSGPNQS